MPETVLISIRENIVMSEDTPQSSGQELVYENYEGSDGIKVNAIELGSEVLTTEHPTSRLRSTLFLIYIIVLCVVSFVLFMKLGMELIDDDLGELFRTGLSLAACLIFIVFVGVKSHRLFALKFKSYLLVFKETEFEVWEVEKDRSLSASHQFALETMSYKIDAQEVELTNKSGTALKIPNSLFVGDTEVKELGLKKTLKRLPAYFGLKTYQFEDRDGKLLLVSRLLNYEEVHVAWPHEHVEAMDPRVVKMVQDEIKKM